MGRVAIVVQTALVVLLFVQSSTTASSSAQVQYDRQRFRKPSSRDGEIRVEVLQRQQGIAEAGNSSQAGEENTGPVASQFQWTEKLFVAVTCVFVATVVFYYAVWKRVCC